MTLLARNNSAFRPPRRPRVTRLFRDQRAILSSVPPRAPDQGASAQPPGARRPPASPSPWSPFRHRAFAVIWTVSLTSNIGGWMSSAAAGWLMTSIDPHPLLVSLVQVASSLPLFLWAIPAGALADIVDRRRLLIVGELAIMAAAIPLAILVEENRITPASLLLISFAVSSGSAVVAPAWQAVVTELVPRAELPAAISANSVGVNVSRAVGPALSGVFVRLLGIAAPFWIDAFSNVGVIGGLLWWRPPARTRTGLPPEPFGSALRTGLRHARFNSPLSATLIRTAAFMIFASAYWGLLPLVTRNQIGGGPTLYGLVLGAIGAAGVAASLALPWMTAKLGADRLLAVATLGTALAMVLFGLAHSAGVAVLAALVAGACWMAAVSSLNLSAQVALPDWVRGRGLAVFVTVLFGAMSLGNSLWGEVAALSGLSAAHFLAAAGALIAAALTWRWKLETGSGLDLSPSMHWPAPITTRKIEGDRGPVLVMVEYRIDPAHRAAFLHALARYSRERRRDGAYEWRVFEDPAEEGRLVEIFLTDSWLEHLHQHARVTRADRLLEQAVRRLQIDPEPKTTHLIAVPRED